MTMIDRMFDAFHKVAAIAHIMEQRRQKTKQIESVESLRCGNCSKWMTSDCKPEKIHKQFKSMNSTGCSDFVVSRSSAELSKKFRLELDQMTLPPTG